VTRQLGNTPVHDTPWSVDQAIGWLLEQVRKLTHPGATGWHNVCLGITAQSYGYAASGTVPQRAGRSGWAIEAWDQARPETKHPGRTTAVPRGGIIHFKRKGDSKPGARRFPGHTATSLGDGTMVTNDLGRDGYITIEPILDAEEKWDMEMVGWREPEFRRGTGRNPATPRPAVLPVVVTPKPRAGVAAVVVTTRVRFTPSRTGKVVAVRKPDRRIWYRGVRTVDSGHGPEVWLRTVAGNWILSKRTTRGA
jgi:hypothetical protein